MQGDLDSVVSEELVHELAQKLSKQKYLAVDCYPSMSNGQVC